MAGGGADMGANKVTETATTPEPHIFHKSNGF